MAVAPKTPPRTTRPQRLLLLAGGLLAALLLLELGLRGTGFLLLTLRDLADRRRSGEKEEVRILCVGESTTYCGGSKSYPRQLEEILNRLGAPRRFIVVNKGIPGTNTGVIANRLESWIESCRPDAVVAMIGVNDGGELMVTPLEEEGGAGERFLKNLRLNKLFTLIREGARRRGGGADGLPDADAETAELVRETEKNPRDAAGFRKLGDALLRRELFDRAAAAYGRAGELEPSPEAFFGLGVALHRSASYPQALSALRRCLELDPDHDRAWTESGRCLLDKFPKDRTKAKEMFSRALAANPRNDMALAGMAYCLWKKRQYREAIDYAERAVAENPRNEWAYGTIRSCRKKMGDYPAALRACERAIAAVPLNNWAYAAAAGLSAKLGDSARAEEYWQRAREIGLAAAKPATRRNYQKIREILIRRKVRLVAMQYPRRPVEQLRRLLAPPGGEIYVSNEENFREALRRDSAGALFKDNFGGDFGHCTPEGNRLIAENLARVILSEVLPPRRTPQR